MAVLVDVRSKPPPTPLGLLEAYSHVVLEVADLDRAREFYSRVLGLSEQPIALSQNKNPRTLPDSGTHIAVRLPRRQLELAQARLAAAGMRQYAYHEDRPQEQADNRYCLDPDGNRVQLVEGEPAGIDHVAVETHDLEWAEIFYTHVLGGVVEWRVGWRMEDFERALRWGAGEDDCAPGTRRWDKRYTSIEGQARVPRPNPHVFINFNVGLVLGVYLATEHRQELPPDQFVGTPRVAFRVAEGRLAELEQRLREIRLRCTMASAELGGPFERHASSLFVRDPGGVFLEFVGP